MDDTWNYYLFLECYFVYGEFIYLFTSLFRMSLRKCMAGYKCFITLTATRNLMEISYKVYNLNIGIIHFL